jgi:hypothetical protein
LSPVYSRIISGVITIISTFGAVLSVWISIINITIISILLFRIVITNLSVCAGYKLTPASAQKRFPLLMPTLDGLTKYAHLIDVDYFADLLQVSHSPPSLHAHTHQQGRAAFATVSCSIALAQA